MSNEPYFEALQELQAEDRGREMLGKALKLVTTILAPNTQFASPRGARFVGKPAKRGNCHDLLARRCNIMKNGGGCGKSARKTRWCPFRLYFIPRKDGTVGQTLSLAGLYLARQLRLRLRELGYE